MNARDGDFFRKVIELYYRSPEGLPVLIAFTTKYFLWLSSYEGLFYIANERARDRIAWSKEIIPERILPEFIELGIDTNKICVN